MSNKSRLVAPVAVLSLSGALGVFSLAQAQAQEGDVDAGCDTTVTVGLDPLSGDCEAGGKVTVTRFITTTTTITLYY